MPVEERLITEAFDTPSGVRIHVHRLPAMVDTATNEVIGFRTSVSAVISLLVQGAVATGHEDVDYPDPPPAPPTEPNPVSLALRAALDARGMTPADLARILNVKPPLVSRWLSPSYREHSMDTLRRIADVLRMNLEVTLTPRAS